MTGEVAETTELESAPSLKRLYVQAVAAPLLPGGDAELPTRLLVLRGAAIEPERVASYARVCGFGVRSTTPATYPHVLAFPLHMSLMTDRSFPFSVLGLVHIANRLEVRPRFRSERTWTSPSERRTCARTAGDGSST